MIVATAYGDALQGLQNLGDLHSKVVIDVTNPLSADYTSLAIGLVTSVCEEIHGRNNIYLATARN